MNKLANIFFNKHYKLEKFLKYSIVFMVVIMVVAQISKVV